MNKAVDEHFRALITQLLHLGNLPVPEDSNEESWLNIITALSWEAARLLKPDMSMGGGMDPGGYVKVKCIASGVLSERYICVALHDYPSLSIRPLSHTFETSFTCFITIFLMMFITLSSLIMDHSPSLV